MLNYITVIVGGLVIKSIVVSILEVKVEFINEPLSRIIRSVIIGKYNTHIPVITN